MIRILSIVALVIITVASCTQPAKDNLEATEAQRVQRIHELADHLAIDTTNSVVTWIGSKPTGQHNGIIALDSGTVSIYQDTLVAAFIRINISSLQVMDIEDPDKNQKLKTHLLSDDFFHESAHPFASFEVTDISTYDSTLVASDQEQYPSEFAPAKLSEFMVASPTHIVSGNLTMRGTTKNISFPAKIERESKRYVIEAKFNIDRTDWKLSYNSEANVVDKAKDRFIYNTVNAGIYLEVPIEDK
ncbi:YceI family protein [Marinoscillum furvescens]|uniref:YceI-like domain-containing protein n=1 Tax=Marinoscillum furvescens DSM 4134 TaxID=1122208 RepID=A0A3D9L6Z8_MARFU|nr:YceI family protein [Marinoscillum furvescens]REE02131.1 YceI-like domain-containing protein [Marinoscillum furvescens DSM 4134]